MRPILRYSQEILNILITTTKIEIGRLLLQRGYTVTASVRATLSRLSPNLEFFFSFYFVLFGDEEFETSARYPI